MASQNLDALDPRARRSRVALFDAVIELVGTRGTSDVSITDIAAAAGLSRPVIYQQFGDRDSLIVEAALDLVRRELLPQLGDGSAEASLQRWTLATASHFAVHRAFYRAILTGPCAYAFDRGLTALRLSINRPLLNLMYGATKQPGLADDIAIFLTGGGTALLNAWLIDGEEPLNAKKFADRVLRTQTALAGLLHLHTAAKPQTRR